MKWILFISLFSPMWTSGQYRINNANKIIYHPLFQYIDSAYTEVDLVNNSFLNLLPGYVLYEKDTENRFSYDPAHKIFNSWYRNSDNDSLHVRITVRIENSDADLKQQGDTIIYSYSLFGQFLTMRPLFNKLLNLNMSESKLKTGYRHLWSGFIDSLNNKVFLFQSNGNGYWTLEFRSTKRS